MGVFAGCFPLRAGALLMTAIQLVLGAGMAFLFWWDIFAHGGSLPLFPKIALYAAASVNTILALVALVGFFGSLARHADLLRSFFIAQIVQTVVSLGAAVVLLASLLASDKNALIAQCTSDNSLAYPTLGSDKSKGGCDGLLQGARYVYGAHLAVLLVLQIYSTLTISSYLDELRNDSSTTKLGALNFEPDDHRFKQTMQGSV